MTESEWLTSSDPQTMLTFLSRRGTANRKHRLFACACCRRIWDRFPDPRNRDLVVAVEDYPNHTFEDPEIHDPAVASSAREGEFREHPPYWVAKTLGRGFYKMTAAVSAAVVSARILSFTDRERDRLGEDNVVALQYGADAWSVSMPFSISLPADAEKAAQAAFLRDIFGNPLRPVSFDSAWRTDTVATLARQMYESREFGAMPILADALQDADCDDENMLNHCRRGGPHVRGCWVVDLVLGQV